MRLGNRQLESLIMHASPACMMVVPGTVERALINRGLLKATITKRGEISFSRITPAGLRALADAMAAGRVEDALVRMKRESVSRRRQAKRRAHG